MIRHFPASPWAHEGWAGWHLILGRRLPPVFCWTPAPHRDWTSWERALSCGQLSARIPGPSPGPGLPPRPPDTWSPRHRLARGGAAGQSQGRPGSHAAQPSAPDTLPPSPGSRPRLPAPGSPRALCLPLGFDLGEPSAQPRALSRKPGAKSTAHRSVCTAPAPTRRGAGRPVRAAQAEATSRPRTPSPPPGAPGLPRPHGTCGRRGRVIWEALASRCF